MKGMRPRTCGCKCGGRRGGGGGVVRVAVRARQATRVCRMCLGKRCGCDDGEEGREGVEGDYEDRKLWNWKWKIAPAAESEL